MSRLPNCFLVGAPKAGSTSLYHYLDQHPRIYMSPIKEPNYFAAEIREENFEPALRPHAARDARSLRKYLDGPMRQKRFGAIVSDWEDYLRLFAPAGDQPVLGEASVCYMWSSSAAERIHARIPDAKILVMLRHPADRAFSDYLQGLGNGAIRCSFREQIERNLRHTSGQFAVHYPFLELGLYAAQLQRFLERFGPNVWVGFYEDYKTQPLEVFRNICRFLGIDHQFSPDMRRRYLEAQVPRTPAVAWFKRTGLWKAAARITPRRLRPMIRRRLVRAPDSTRMDAADRRFLLQYYREDIHNLAGLLGRNLDSWLRE
ncbi:MAG TPA: sulfotransferase [Bryobacteraceae bacterium]|nr:sulfotransferase [Bryobacteraceae bacterium]